MNRAQLSLVIVAGAIATVVAASVSVVSLVLAGLGMVAWTTPSDTPPSTSTQSEATPSPEGTDSSLPWLHASYSDPVIYDVRDGELVEAASGRPADAQLGKVWTLFAAIAGPDAASIVDVAVSDDRTESTDASVARDQKDPTLWHVEINMASARDVDYVTRTLVHEYGHLTSLSVNDVAEVDGACPDFRFSEGCVSQKSVLGRFLDAFWSDDESGAESEGASPDDAQARFDAAGGTQTFVSEYAATNGAEDFAETFASYVLGPDTALEPGSVAQQKIDLLAADSRMQKARERITAAIAAR